MPITTFTHLLPIATEPWERLGQIEITPGQTPQGRAFIKDLHITTTKDNILGWGIYNRIVRYQHTTDPTYRGYALARAQIQP